MSDVTEEDLGAPSAAPKDATQVLRDAAVDEPKSSIGADVLPCGYIDEAGALHTSYVVREIDGEVEDMLGSSQIPPFLKLDMLIAKCIERIGPYSDPAVIADKVVPALTIGDRIFLLFQIRRVSLGDDFHFDLDCTNPNCVTMVEGQPVRNRSRYTLNLGGVEIRPMGRPEQRTYVKNIQPRGAAAPFPVTFHVMTGRDEHRIARLDSAESAHAGSLQILARLDQYGDRKIDWGPKERNGRALLAFVKGLPISSRNALRDAFEEVEGGVDTEIEVDCPFCLQHIVTEMVLDAGFFRPSAEMSRRSKRR